MASATLTNTTFDDTPVRIDVVPAAGDINGCTFQNANTSGKQEAIRFNISGTHVIEDATFSGNTTDLRFQHPSGTATVNLDDSTTDPTTEQDSTSRSWQLNERTTYDVNVKDSVGNEQNVRVYLENTSVAQEFSVLTDVNGDIAQQKVLRRDQEHTAGLPKTPPDETVHNPFILKMLKYGKIPIIITGKNFGETALVEAYIISDDAFATTAEATVEAYTGATVNGPAETITISVNRTLTEIYEFLKDWEADNPSEEDIPIMETNDGLNFTCKYDFIINTGITVTATNQDLTITNSKTFTINGTGDFTGSINDGTDFRVHLNITPLQTNTEIRVYDDLGGGSRGSELGGVENSSTSFDLIYTIVDPAVDQDMIVTLHHETGFEANPDIFLTAGKKNATLPVSQRPDRNYSNP